MTSVQIVNAHAGNLMGQAELPPSVFFGETEMEMWPYRTRTAALLRRYARASVEVGRLPSLLGREFFRTQVTSYTMRNFEDVVIFVTDMEKAIEKLSAIDKKLLAMNVLEEYDALEVARLLGCTPRNVRRLIREALDELARILLAGGLLEKMASGTRGRESCQGGKSYDFDVSNSNDGKNKRNYHLHKPYSKIWWRARKECPPVGHSLDSDSSANKSYCSPKRR
ncbi:MAG: sigma factor-like helix-turn-helix DNA-binding protein [Terriglobales bacterium]